MESLGNLLLRETCCVRVTTYYLVCPDKYLITWSELKLKSGDVAVVSLATTVGPLKGWCEINKRQCRGSHMNCERIFLRCHFVHHESHLI